MLLKDVGLLSDILTVFLRAVFALQRRRARLPQAEETSAGSEAAARKERMKERTFDVDVFACMRCGGRRRVLAYVKGAAGVRAILEHLGLPTASAHLADAMHPALLQMVARVTEVAHAQGRRVGVCGELAGEALTVPLLLGLGVDELSVSVPAFATVKQALRECRASEAQSLAQRALACTSAAEVRRLATQEQ